MKLFRLGLTVMITFLSISSIHAQTADEIINKHIDAIGGKDVLAKIKSIYLEGTATAMGADYPTNTTVLVGKGFKNVTSVNGSDIIQCITDTSGWTVNPFAGQTGPTALSADAIKNGKSSLNVGGELFNFKDKGFSDSLTGRDSIEGVYAYKIKLAKPGIEMVYFIDPGTFYILKTETKLSVDGNDMLSTKTFSNYKKTDAGYVVPYTLGITNMGYDVTLNYTKVEVNKDVDPSIFAMPK